MQRQRCAARLRQRPVRRRGGDGAARHAARRCQRRQRLGRGRAPGRRQRGHRRRARGRGGQAAGVAGAGAGRGVRERHQRGLRQRLLHLAPATR